MRTDAHTDTHTSNENSISDLSLRSLGGDNNDETLLRVTNRLSVHSNLSTRAYVQHTVSTLLLTTPAAVSMRISATGAGRPHPTGIVCNISVVFSVVFF